MEREAIEELIEKWQVSREEIEEKVQVVKNQELAAAKIIINNQQNKEGKKKFNALSTPVFMGLLLALDDLKRDPAIKVVVVEGEGTLAFCAGADIDDILTIKSAEEAKEKVRVAKEVANQFENLGKPTIASINGLCLGGGLEIALACSYRIVSSGSRGLGQPEVGLGIIPGMGGTQRLPRLVGVKIALKLILTCVQLLPNQAKQIGLVDEVVPDLGERLVELITQFANNPVTRTPINLNPNEIDETLTELGSVLDLKPQLAVEAAVKAVREGIGKSLSEALELETNLFSELLMTEDAQEGLSAFGKRTPQFKHVKKTKVAEVAEVVEEKKQESEDDLSDVRAAIKDFAKDKLFPRVEQIEKDGKIPEDLLKEIAGLGYYGIPYPEKYGGSGLGATGACILLEELARRGGSVPIYVGIQIGIGTIPVYLFGTEEQKQKYLAPAIKGEKIGAFALTEPEAGSDAANVKTMAKKVGNKWILNGTKQFISGGTGNKPPDFLIVFAQTDKLGRDKTMAAFIVESCWKGFQVLRVEEKSGLHAINTSALAFDDVEVPEENLLGKVGEGFKIAMTTLNEGRLVLAAGCLGIAKEAFNEAWDYANKREQFGQPIIVHEMIMDYLAQMYSYIDIMEPAIYDAAKKLDAGEDIRLHAAALKLRSTEWLDYIVEQGLQIRGGLGIMKDDFFDRLRREIRVNKIWEGTNEIQKILIVKDFAKMTGGKL